MKAHIRTVWVAREGNAPSEYEDSFFPKKSGVEEGACDTDLLHTAVADGAGGGFLGGEWAAVLTEVFGSTKVSAIDVAVDLALVDWAGRYQAYHDERLAAASNEVVRYHTEQKLASGAAATFLILEALDGSQPGMGRWRAEVIGDCCLFFRRPPAMQASRLWCSFPFQSAAELEHAPDLVSTKASADVSTLRSLSRRMCGEWVAGDRFYLVTDEMARWIFSAMEGQAPPWSTLNELSQGSLDEFAAWAASRRAASEMKNDDLTLQAVTLGF